MQETQEVIVFDTDPEWELYHRLMPRVKSGQAYLTSGLQIKEDMNEECKDKSKNDSIT